MRRLIAIAMVLLALNACGDSDNPAAPSGGGGDTGGGPVGLANGSMSARIDGAAWNANFSIVGGYSQGILAIAGGDSAQQTIAFGVAANGPGTFSTAALSNVNFTLATVAPGGTVAATWTAVTGLPGTSGTVTITSLSSTTAVGTFSFSATPTSGPATGTKTITDGTFNVRF
jgi:hypothetical protein